MIIPNPFGIYEIPQLPAEYLKKIKDWDLEMEALDKRSEKVNLKLVRTIDRDVNIQLWRDHEIQKKSEPLQQQLLI